MKLAALLVVPLVAFPLALCAAPSTRGSTTLRKGSYRFEISTASRTGEWFGWWGGPDRGPGVAVTALRAFRGGRRLYVPPSAFAGLADPHGFTLRQTKAGMELRIVGSDAGGAWEGAFLFDGRAIVARTVRDGEFPDLSYERTTYRSIKDGEVN